MKYEKGDRIRYTRGPLGAMSRVDSTKMLDSQHDVDANERGYYVEPHPVIPGWHVTSKIKRGGLREIEYPGPFVMVHEDMIEPVRVNLAVLRQEDGKETDG